MFGFLIPAALLTAICVLAVVPPMPASSSPSHWTYSAGTFLANELPFVALFWFALWTTQAAIAGHLTHPVGIAALAVTAIGVAAVAVIARRGFGARSELRTALESAYGPAVAASMPSTHRWWQIVLAPIPFRGRAVRRVANLAYGDAGRRNLLDVYHHRSRSGGPVLVYFHGGGFRSGHKNREGKPLLHRLARRGWVCISANYRLAPQARFPDPLVDAQRALAWARRNADRYGGDPDRIVVAGSSAGGHLAAMCALTACAHGSTGDPDAAAPVAAISLYGFYGSPGAEPGARSSPHDHVHPAAPPMFIAHGDNDTIVLVDDARRFVRHLDAMSAQPVVYAELHGAHHGFDLFRSARCEAVVDAIEVFATQALAA